MKSTQDQPHRLGVYVRLGAAGEAPRADEHRIGTVSIDKPGGVAAAIVELFRLAAFEVEQETLATPREERPTMSDPHHLNPGSVDAINQGCTCSGADNGWGRGGYNLPEGKFWIAADCPLHGHLSDLTKEEP